MNFKLVILCVLARSPGRPVALGELRREVESIIEFGDPGAEMKRSPALDDIDIFEAGLVSRDPAGLQITDLGLSMLRSLESTASPLNVLPTAALRSIDELIGTRERLRIFDLELRGLDGGGNDGAGFEPLQPESLNGSEPAIAGPDVVAEPEVDHLPETIDLQIPDTVNSNVHQRAPDESEEMPAIRPVEAAAPDPPAVLQRRFGSKALAPSRYPYWQSEPVAFITAKGRLVSDLWRRHFAPSKPNTTIAGRGLGSAPIALLTFLTLVGCAAAAIALGQLKSLKSEIAEEHRDVLYLRERLARLEQAQKASSLSDQQTDAHRKPDPEEKKPGADQAALNLSREEVQLIRDYIKPAPSAGNGAPAISVGDPVGGATIPLPSPLTEKIPRLLGAGFTTRGGTIIIVKKDSRQADAVLAAN
jgi:hypothetical protein